MPSPYPTEVLSTRKRGNRARGSPSPIVLMLSLLPHRRARLTPNHHSSDPVASLTSRSICCSHHQRCGTAPLFCSPCLHLVRIGRVATYTAIVCRQTVMYAAVFAVVLRSCAGYFLFCVCLFSALKSSSSSCVCTSYTVLHCHHSLTLCYTILHDDTLSYTILHYFTLSYTFHTISHCAFLIVGGKLVFG